MRGRLASALYEGRVSHRRRAPFDHGFSLPFFMTWLDLSELDRVFAGRWLWSARRFAFARFRRSDYLGDAQVPLDQAVRDLVEERLGRRPTGPVRLLTHLRTAGVRMNPLSLYYCYDASGDRLEAVVAEVTNTPWDERHCYVLDLAREADAVGPHAVTAEKVFHVSPFMPMDQSYRFVIDEPGRRLGLRIENRDETGERVFEAGLAMRRVELGAWSMARALLRYPFVTAQVAVGIYLQAALLWWKGARFHSHPGKPEAGVAVADGGQACRQATSFQTQSSITSSAG